MNKIARELISQLQEYWSHGWLWKDAEHDKVEHKSNYQYTPSEFEDALVLRNNINKGQLTIADVVLTLTDEDGDIPQRVWDELIQLTTVGIGNSCYGSMGDGKQWLFIDGSRIYENNWEGNHAGRYTSIDNPDRIILKSMLDQIEGRHAA